MLLRAAFFVAFPLMALAQDQFMMVFGGVPRSRDVYLLSLDPEVEIPNCLRELDQHPKEQCWISSGESTHFYLPVSFEL